MAFDKVIDSAKLDNELKNLADILREKSETSEELDFYAGDFSRVAESIEFIGVKHSNFDEKRGLPRTADARSLDLAMSENIKAANDMCLYRKFQNDNTNGNGGYYASLEEVYLPSRATAMTFTFICCTALKNIYGNLSNITSIISTFQDCRALENIPDMPNLTHIGNGSFARCYALKEYRIPSKVNSIHSGAFTGCSNLLDIYCSFAEGEVANAPWGATNATIHYNTTYDENGNPITE